MRVTNQFGSANLVYQSFMKENMNYIMMDDILYFHISDQDNCYKKVQDSKEVQFLIDDLCVVGRCKEVGKTTYNRKYLELMEKYFHLSKEIEERLFVFVITDIQEKRLLPVS